MSVQEWLKSLNPIQYQAVTAPPCNLLVLAGAGSGKTRVLTYRIAWLVSEAQASLAQIFAVTFTNKAAAEMKERLHQLLGPDVAHMWKGTFHGLCHKFLRKHWQAAGLPEQFQVLDSDDQLQLIKRVIKSLSLNEEHWEPKKAQGYINRKKDEGIRPRQVGHAHGIYEQTMMEIYLAYEKLCRDNGLVDFAELLLRSYETLKTNPELLQHYQSRFLHFLVDEFQDTNTIQYLWFSLLSQKAQSVTIVGDDDQSIYGWRGAKVENITRFEQEFQTVKVIRLEQNYRSTETILSAANALISNNLNRMGKNLWTQDGKGESISLYCAFNEEDEALFVVRQIRAWIEKGGVYQDLAILYRSNAQSRVIEEALMRASIPYIVYGGLRFFERAEIKDALAYLRLIANCHDNAAFERAIHVPSRGIGDKSFEKIMEISSDKAISLWSAGQIALDNQVLAGKAKQGLQTFMETITSLKNRLEQDDISLALLVKAIVEETGLLQFFKEQKGEKAQNRVENLRELANAVQDFELELPEDTLPLRAFLDYTALESGERTNSDDNNAVQLMTLHSAKGLEYPVVFICGLEEGLFPHYLASESDAGLEEERRLCYVGITRARQKLYLTHAETRRLFGREESRKISRFVGEIPEHLMEETRPKISVKRPFSLGISYEKRQQTLSTKMPTIIPNARDMNGDGYSLGQRVMHPKFGCGTILDYEGEGEKARVHIHFDMYGSKWLALSYAKLEPA